MRRAEAKMGVLKEVIERVQAGETVDVESVLRTGDAVSEKEWREVLGDIAREEALFRSKKGRRAERAAQKEDSAIAPSQEQDVGREGHVDEGNAKVESLNGARFY